jgi:hypothetical protein
MSFFSQIFLAFLSVSRLGGFKTPPSYPLLLLASSTPLALGFGALGLYLGLWGFGALGLWGA